MDLSPHLNFNGQCADAFRFYEQCLGGKISVLMTYSQAPSGVDAVPADARDKVMHAHLDLGGGRSLMGCDAPAPHYAKPQGISVSLTFPTPADAQRAFNALADKGKVTMPFQKTFWSSGFGMAVDRFGIPWMVNTAQAA